jgi:hypothetical protein
MAKPKKKAKKLGARKQSVKDMSPSKAKAVKGGALASERQPRAVKLS